MAVSDPPLLVGRPPPAVPADKTVALVALVFVQRALSKEPDRH